MNRNWRLHWLRGGKVGKAPADEVVTGSLAEHPAVKAWCELQHAGHRALAGRWLGRLHVAALSAEMKARLPDRGPSHYLQRLRGVRATVGEHLGNPALPADDLSLLQTVAGHCDTLESHWDEVEACCAAMP